MEIGKQHQTSFGLEASREDGDQLTAEQERRRTSPSAENVPRSSLVAKSADKTASETPEARALRLADEERLCPQCGNELGSPGSCNVCAHNKIKTAYLERNPSARLTPIGPNKSRWKN